MDTLTSINVFRQVVDLGSFVRAAEQLDLSTAMVSKHVMSIEKRLGVRLLNRNSHKLSLTEPGRFYLQRCRSILDELQKTELELESLNTAPRGTLRIACCDTSIPSIGLAGMLAEYRRRWPEVSLDISFVDRAVDLVEEGYDLAFCLVDDERLPAGMVARRVRDVPFRLGASHAYLQRNGVPNEPSDLSQHDFITSEAESVSLTGAGGTVEIPLRVALRCRTLSDVAVTVAAGMGIAVLPAALFSDPAFVHVLRPVLPDFRLRQSTLYLLYPGRKYVPFKVRALIDLALESGDRPQQPTIAPAVRTRPAANERLRAVAG